MTEKSELNFPDMANVVLGVWLLASPWMLGFAGLQAAMLNAVVFGVVIAALAVAALVRFRDWEEWVDMAIGLWLIVSPWLLGFNANPMALWNFVIVGALALLMAGWALREHHGGHLI